MPRALSLSDLSSMAAASQFSLRQRLLAATKDREARIDVTGPLPASQLLETYRVRLRLWEEDVLPTMAGFPEFVEAIGTAGDQPVSLAVYQERDRRFVLLMSGDHGSLLGAVEIARGPDERPLPVALPTMHGTPEKGACCQMMADQLDHRCDEHADRRDCPDALIGTFPDGRTGLMVHDGGQSMILIAYCPWCGRPTGTALDD